MDVDLSALAHNFEAIKRHVGSASVMPILKADAYGHGLLACAQKLQSLGAEMFGVAFVEEALSLRRSGITTAILALGGISGRQVASFIDYEIDITASSKMKIELVDSLAAAMGKRARIHLKIDTGMERIGTHYYSAEPLIDAAISAKHCDVVAVFSHLACAESEDDSFTKLQLERFLETTSIFDKRSIPMPKRHLANSGAILQHPDTHLDIVRPGLLLYGYSPTRELGPILDLKPMMSVRSEVVYFKVVQKGAVVSYDSTWTCPEDTRVVTIPAGYGDGYPRQLSNIGHVLIDGQRKPIIGKVCMDQFMVNLGAEGEAYNGDEVVLLGEQKGERIDALEIAELVGTDPRDILLSLALRMPRRYVS
jgi:alanine racemase